MVFIFNIVYDTEREFGRRRVARSAAALVEKRMSLRSTTRVPALMPACIATGVPQALRCVLHWEARAGLVLGQGRLEP
jgi:hypothetical protein